MFNTLKLQWVYIKKGIIGDKFLLSKGLTFQVVKICLVPGIMKGKNQIILVFKHIIIKFQNLKRERNFLIVARSKGVEAKSSHNQMSINKDEIEPIHMQ